ncbi:protein strawberry notch-like [Gossypium australe]|uniref:Protein strawberry notch-like n=1 Tax=Gossypium australe TaxID=47621 RepID=A0A5B6U7R3_9ROSI|nr:protein strawberry notch-like [Gossypium australe]
MPQPSIPPLPLAQQPPPAPTAGPAAPGVQVRCAGCRMILSVGPGVTEFVCPTCQLPQMLPPELMTRARINNPPPNQSSVPAHGIDPTKIQLPCANCKAILNVPYGLARFSCPQCGVDLAVDLNKMKQLFPPPQPRPPLPPEEVNEVAIEVEREEDEGGPVGETFTDYVRFIIEDYTSFLLPSFHFFLFFVTFHLKPLELLTHMNLMWQRPPKLSIGPPHPDPIVETSSLSAVQPPEPTYDLRIKDDLENSKALSCLQIETLVYACQRHLQHLPSGARAGFFVGDGAGVGKGRTIAGLIWENWHHARRKAIWISVGSDLKFDARRDLDDVGAACIEVHALNKLPYSKLDSKSVGINQGVVFLTYSSLIASSEKGRSRLQQLVQWCGSGFDGLIIFDECHKAKNLVPEAGSQPTRTGEAVLEIQARLPEARVIYCSATGASEPRNMGYMIRLGLWGAGTSFPDFQSFLGLIFMPSSDIDTSSNLIKGISSNNNDFSLAYGMTMVLDGTLHLYDIEVLKSLYTVALEKGGVGALELVAMDMKARGMYVCRTLSYKGAEFEVIEAPLEAEMEVFRMWHGVPMTKVVNCMHGAFCPFGHKPLIV